MPKRIVICPSFAESHLIKCHIPNINEIINPDAHIYCEGLFPQGPENKGHVDTEEFKKKWCYKDTMLGFDYKLSVEPLPMFVEMSEMNYGNISADDAYRQAIANFGYHEPQVGDLIFPLEPDAFLWEGDKEIIEEELSKLKPGEGLSCKWVDFLETQYYTEAINLVQPKYRRFVYCFDSMENYLKAMDGFTSQNYPLLKKTDKFFIRHYSWFRPEPWKQLRYELIYRENPQYWQNFENGLREIRKWSEYILSTPDECAIPKKILIRPSRQDDGRWAQYIDVPHPNSIQSHPNFIN